MKSPGDGILLRIFVGESDTHESKPVYEWITLKARQLGLAGVTVNRGIMGFGANSRLHTSKVLRLSEDMPVVIEAVDIEENINKLLPYLDACVREGMVTLEKVKVISYRHNEQKGRSGGD